MPIAWVRALMRLRYHASPARKGQRVHSGGIYYIGMSLVRIEQHTGLGLVWAAGWLFTIGFLQLAFWQGVFAIIIWPYYLGAFLAAVH